MKGLTTFMLAVFLLILGLVIFFSFIGIVYTYNPTETGTTFTPTHPSVFDKFNYTTYVLAQNPVDLATYDECYNLKNAIKNAIIYGRPYKVDEISYGNDLYSSVGFPFIGDCLTNGEILDTTITSGLVQEVCTLRTINANPVQGRSAFGGVSDIAGLYFDDCYYEPFADFPLTVTGAIGPNEIFGPTDTANVYLSPDYLYIRNGDYVHYLSPNNESAFDNAYNGPGTLTIYVGDATSINGECRFNLYFCPRPAIAETKEDDIINVFNIFRNLEIYDIRYLPYYIRNVTDLTTEMGGYERLAYYWNYYEVNLTEPYRVETVINAVKSGLYESFRGKNYLWAHPHWDIRSDSIDKREDCWDPSYDTGISSSATENRTRSIRYNCGADNVCRYYLKIRVGLRHDFRYEDIDGDLEDERLNYLSGIVTFCENMEPIVSFTETKTVAEVGETIDFDASATTDGDGDPLDVYLWDFGDGSTTAGVTASHAYSNVGTFTVNLTVNDIYGANNFSAEDKIIYQCGNGLKEGLEECDGLNFGTEDCTTRGYDLGTLICTAPGGVGDPNECKIDTSNCYYNTTITSTVDSYVYSGIPSANYGSSAVLRSGFSGLWIYRTWIRFSLSSIPIGATVNSANVYTYESWVFNGPWTYEIRGSSNDAWTEGGIIWSNQPAYGGVLDTEIVSLPANHWVNWDVTANAQAEVNAGSPAATYVITRNTESGLGATVDFRSSETTRRPYMIVIHR